jgi:protein TilB
MVEVMNEELLRRRAEHNDGCLSDLKEITLHQFELPKIEPILHEQCRQLQQLFLQSNLIEKIENLHHLKDLRYLNLAVNSLTKIENLEANEMLQRLDLTVNYITDIFSVENLKSNYNLRELTLMGNPITRLKGYRLFVIGVLPQLWALDSEPIKKDERILAEEHLAGLRVKMVRRQKELLKELEKEKENSRIAEENGEKLYGNDPESRKAAAEELQKKRERKGDQSVNASSIGEIDRIGQEASKRSNLTPQEEIEKYGKVMQKNEGKWDFKFLEKDDCYTCDIPAGKYMSQAYINVDLQPTYLRVTIKGKVLQLRLDHEVDPDKASAQRSKATGNLLITMPKASTTLTRK